jgi:hypothetical protein
LKPFFKAGVQACSKSCDFEGCRFKLADRAQHIASVAACEAFEQKTASTDADRKAWVSVVMRRAPARAGPAVPSAAEPADKIGARRFQIAVAGCKSGHEKALS